MSDEKQYTIRTEDQDATATDNVAPVSAFATLTRAQCVQKFWRLYATGLGVSVAGLYAHPKRRFVWSLTKPQVCRIRKLCHWQHRCQSRLHPTIWYGSGSSNRCPGLERLPHRAVGFSLLRHCSAHPVCWAVHRRQIRPQIQHVGCHLFHDTGKLAWIYSKKNSSAYAVSLLSSNALRKLGGRY
jgi:hypothetical protein